MQWDDLRFVLAISRATGLNSAAKLLGMRTDTAAVLTAPEEGSAAGSMIPVCYNSETLAKEMLKIKSRDKKGTILLMLITRDRVGGCLA